MSWISGAVHAMHDWLYSLYLTQPQSLSIFVPPVSGLPLMVGRSTNQKLPRVFNPIHAKLNGMQSTSNPEINQLTWHDGDYLTLFFRELKRQESQTKRCRVKEGAEKGFIKLF